MPIDLKDLAETLEALATTGAIVVGALWAYRRYFRQREDYPLIQFGVAVNFVGFQEGHWLVELVATVENKGLVQHKIKRFTFDLRAIAENQPLAAGGDRINNQVEFPVKLWSGSWLPPSWVWTFVEPGVCTRYSYLALVPRTTRFVLLHGRFSYDDSEREFHTAAAVAAVPSKPMAM